MDNPRYTTQDAQRAKALEAELAQLHAQRAGQYEPGTSWAWCVGCGRHTVWPDEGLDTCAACLETTAG